jgi:hypothetical protein
LWCRLLACVRQTQHRKEKKICLQDVRVMLYFTRIADSCESGGETCLSPIRRQHKRRDSCLTHPVPSPRPISRACTKPSIKSSNASASPPAPSTPAKAPHPTPTRPINLAYAKRTQPPGASPAPSSILAPPSPTSPGDKFYPSSRRGDGLTGTVLQRRRLRKLQEGGPTFAMMSQQGVFVNSCMPVSRGRRKG